MSFLFWLLFVLDLLLVILTLGASDFRSSFGAGTNFNNLILLATIISLFASLVTRYYFRQNRLSLLVVAIPILFLVLIYVFEKISG
ncbi:MAG: hypothetical protein WAT91_02095, partial [Saprospiraceae bacterium]